MSAVRFGGEGKWRGEWGVKRGETTVPFPGEEGSSGGGSGRSGFRRKKTAGRLTGRARLSVRGRRRGWLGQKEEGERWAAARPEGGGREVGRGWARNRKWPDSRNKILSNFIWNLDFWQTLEICTRRFRMNFDMGILLGFSRIFRK
jgi:hypothetical protein